MHNRKKNIYPYITASTVSAIINFPLWKASAIKHSAYSTNKSYIHLLLPPYRGAGSVILGMSWARLFIFYGSDIGTIYLKSNNFSNYIYNSAPPLVCTSIVQVINMPLIRASIMMQNTETYNQPNYKNTFTTLKTIIQLNGFSSLWHGLSAGIGKTVPKYMISINVKNLFSKNEFETNNEFIIYSTVKAVTAGISGAILTNPMDVLRNEMFKTNQSLFQTWKSLNKLNGKKWMFRGLLSNVVAVSFPISTTVFLTDIFQKLNFSL